MCNPISLVCSAILTRDKSPARVAIDQVAWSHDSVRLRRTESWPGRESQGATTLPGVRHCSPVTADARKYLMYQCRARESNPDGGCPPAVFKTAASAISPARRFAVYGPPRKALPPPLVASFN